MDGQAVERIAELAKQNMTIEMPDGIYSRESFTKVEPPVHHPSTLVMTTLSSFVSLIKENPQKFDLEGAVVTIDKDFAVSLLSPPRQDGYMDCYASTKSPILPFQF